MKEEIKIIPLPPLSEDTLKLLTLCEKVIDELYKGFEVPSKYMRGVPSKYKTASEVGMMLGKKWIDEDF